MKKQRKPPIKIETESDGKIVEKFKKSQQSLGSKRLKRSYKADKEAGR